jgi:hypothetical protein
VSRFHIPLTRTCISSSTSSAEPNSGNSPPAVRHLLARPDRYILYVYIENDHGRRKV